MSEQTRDALAEVLAAHEQCEIRFRHNGAHTCDGGFIPIMRYDSIMSARRSHLADALAAHVRAERAAALREAADELDRRWYEKQAAMPDTHETSLWLDGHESAEAFVLERADQIEGSE